MENNALGSCYDLNLIYTPKFDKKEIKCDGCKEDDKCPICRKKLNDCYYNGL